LDLCTASVKNLRCAQIHTTEIQPERKRIPQGLLSSARPLQERDMGRQARIQAVRTDAARQAIRGIPEGSRRLATQDGPPRSKARTRETSGLVSLVQRLAQSGTAQMRRAPQRVPDLPTHAHRPAWRSSPRVRRVRESLDGDECVCVCVCVWDESVCVGCLLQTNQREIALIRPECSIQTRGNTST